METLLFLCYICNTGIVMVSGMVKGGLAGRRTVHVSVRAPESVVRAIGLLVDLGLFKDRSDFVNYAIYEALRRYLSSVRIEVAPELVDRYFELLREVSPRLSEGEVLRVLRDERGGEKGSG